MLRTLSGVWLRTRVCDLYEQGWSLAAIAEALDPPRARTTVRSWVTSSSSSAASSSTFGTAEKVNLEAPSAPAPTPVPAPAPAPEHMTPPRTPPPRRETRLFDPRYPTVNGTDAEKIRRLAPLARRHRARANPHGEYARANRELTELCRALYQNGTPIRELADLAGVTYKAMERRVKT